MPDCDVAELAIVIPNSRYNLQGNPVENPEPGTIYIQNGEKRIAR